MIATSPYPRQPQAPPWQAQMAAAVRTPEELVTSLALPEELLPASRAASGFFPLLVPRAWLARMARADVNDALLRQVLPAAAAKVILPPLLPNPGVGSRGDAADGC